MNDNMNLTSSSETSEKLKKELEEIEQIVIDNLEACKSINESFAQFSSSYYEAAKQICNEMNENDSYERLKEKAAEAAANYIIASGIDAVGNVYNAIKTKNLSSKLLIQKQKIAKEKMPRLAGTINRCKSACKSNLKILQHYNNLRFKIYFNKEKDNTIEVESIINKFASQIDMKKQALGMYRRSLLNLYYLTYTECQYKAWLNDRHDDNNVKKPTLELINNAIIDNNLFPLSNEDIRNEEDVSGELIDIMDNIIENKQEFVDGRFMYILTDNQLLSSVLSRLDNAILLVEKKDSISAVVMEYLKNNSAYAKLSELYEIYDDNEGSILFRKTLYYLNAIIITAIMIITMVYFTNWNPWAEWIIGASLSIFGFVKAYKASEKANETYELKKSYIVLYIHNSLRKIAGYEPETTTMTEMIEKANSTLWGIVIGGIIGFFLPIVGGWLIGAILGAVLTGSTVSQVEKESDGSEYESIHYGSTSKGCLLNICMLALVIYLICQI